jgi:hypothetical protein
LSGTEKHLIPLTIPYVKYNPKKDLYKLKIQVNDLKPIERFVRGGKVD